MRYRLILILRPILNCKFVWYAAGLGDTAILIFLFKHLRWI